MLAALLRAISDGYPKEAREEAVPGYHWVQFAGAIAASIFVVWLGVSCLLQQIMFRSDKGVHKTTKTGSAVGLFATPHILSQSFNGVSCIYLTMLVTLGASAWPRGTYDYRGNNNYSLGNDDSRLPPELDFNLMTAEGFQICTAMLAYQLFNIAVCLCIQKYRTMTNFVHHFSTAALVFLGCVHGSFHYYAPFYFGVCELSTTFLCLVDIMKCSPQLQATWPRLNLGIQAVFSFSFFLTRTFGFTAVNIMVWGNGIKWIRHGWATGRLFSQPNNIIDISIMLVINVIITCLQYIWTFLIIKKAIRRCLTTPGSQKGGK